jgi:hypothetical protein
VALSLGVKRLGSEADRSIPRRGEENVDLYIHFPIRLHGVIFNYSSTGTTLSFTFCLTLLRQSDEGGSDKWGV